MSIIGRHIPAELGRRPNPGRRRGRPAELRGQAEMPDKLNEEERRAYAAEVERLMQEHRDLDAAIAALEIVGAVDQLQVQRLKKRKLILRDRIAFLEDQLTPDIIA